MENRIHFADVGQEFIPQPLACTRSADDPRDIHHPQRGRDDLLRLLKLIDHLEPIIRHGNHADVRLDGRERIISRQRPRRGECVEDGALANIGQTDNSDFQCH